MTDTEQTLQSNNNTFPNTTTTGNEEQPSVQENDMCTNSLKRTAPEEPSERDVKVMKLETETCVVNGTLGLNDNNAAAVADGSSPTITNPSEKEADENNNTQTISAENGSSAPAVIVNNNNNDNNDTNSNNSNADNRDAAGVSTTTNVSTAPENEADNGNSNNTTTENNESSNNTENINGNNTNNGNNNGTLMTIHNGPTPPPGLHLLNDSQHQQLLQSYVQASGQDLANLTASSLAQAMVSPIAVPGLTTNLLQQLQGGNVITALPGPPQLNQQNAMPHHPSNVSPIPEDAQGGKRPNSRAMSNDERRQRRLLRNRVAAKECRKKKKQHIHDMEQKIVHLEEENARLHKEVEELNAKLALGAMQGSESYRLMKEVEELNAKLGMGHLPSGGALTAAVMAAASAHQQAQQSSQQQQQTENTTSPQQLSPAQQPSPQQTAIVSPHEAVKELTSETAVESI